MVSNVLQIVKVALAAFIMTVLLVFVCAFLALKLGLSDSQLGICATVITIFSSVVAGMIAGKAKKSKTFLWGAIAGLIYFIMILVASLVAGGRISNMGDIITRLLICVGGGMIGSIIDSFV